LALSLRERLVKTWSLMIKLERYSRGNARFASNISSGLQNEKD
jgi:hypothetical protein